MKNFGVKQLVSAVCALTIGIASVFAGATDTETLSIERFALYVASNRGGSNRETLKYAGTDAYKVAATMQEIGGIKDENSLILIDPVKSDIEKALGKFEKQIAGKKSDTRRTEFLFYYSGHSDESDLLLGNERYSYPQLKKALTDVNADVQVVMLDSCYSGNFVRAKGGSREKPFLLDNSTVVKGHAYLSSSSEFEASQEADAIQSSYFTYALVTGMRGAADTSGDGKISLNELYHYAFNDTLSRTEFSMAGPQHPSYNITLVGSGDLILTDVSQAESALVLDKELEGRFFIRNSAGNLVAEINKIYGTDISMALPAGTYTVSIVKADTTAQTLIVIQKGQYLYLDGNGFVKTDREAAQTRGSVPAEEINESVPAVFNLGLWPGFGFNLFSDSPDAAISINLFASKNRNIRGLQTSIFSNTVTNDLTGVQASAIVNTAHGSVTGVQGAGIVNTAYGLVTGVQGAGIVNTAKNGLQGVQGAGFMNTAGGENSLGVQGAGFMNISRGQFNGVQGAGFMNIANNVTGLQAAGFLNIANKVNGVQAGIINVAKEVNGVSLGLFNFIANGIMSPAVYADSGKNLFVQYQGGTNLFYTVFYAGTPWDFSFEYLILGAGIGARLPVGRFLSFDFDFSSKSYLTLYGNSSPVEIVDSKEKFGKTWASTPSFRLSANFSIAKHFSIFGGAAFDMTIAGYNNIPAYAVSPLAFGNSTVKMHPSFFAGLKF